MTATTTDRNPKALLLDDDTTVLRLLGTGLEARGFDVRAATDGEAGLALLLDELLDLDVLVLDLELPRRNGWALLDLVRRAGGETDLRIVVLASNVDAAARDRLLALGADVVVDRRAGHAAIADAVAAMVRREVRPSRRPLAAARAIVVRTCAALAIPRLAPAA